MTKTAKVPGSCGELAQGIIDGRDMLITCPVSWYSEASIEFIPPTDQEKHAKAYQAVRRLLSDQKKEEKHSVFSLSIRSDLPRGKGMASSTADIAASCAAAARALDIPVDREKIKKIALEIEPTDGVFFPGIVLFDHIRGDKLNVLGEPPDIKIAVVDFGGTVDTIAFNQRADLSCLRQKHKAELAESYALIKAGLATGNPVLIGKGATISALANQAILPKAGLQKVMLIANDYGALGVNVAHSGTVAGILFDAARADNLKSCAMAAVAVCPGLAYLGAADMASGGIRI